MKKYHIADSHCHLDFYINENIDDVDANININAINDVDYKKISQIIEESHNVGVTVIHTICTKLQCANRIRSIAERCDGVYCSVGMHPLEIPKCGIACAQQIIEMCIGSKKVISIGEVGLDYYNLTDLDPLCVQLQRDNFIEHIKASHETGLPLVVHARNADRDIFEILQHFSTITPISGVMHCFTGDEEFALACINLGMYISISGIITFKNAGKLRDIVKKLPLDRILVETDAPYLAPHPYRGQKNYPKYIVKVIKCISELHDMTYDEVSEVIWGNFCKCFAL